MKNRFIQCSVIGLFSLFYCSMSFARIVLVDWGERVCTVKCPNTLGKIADTLKMPPVTEIDTFLCNQFFLKVGGRELKPGGTYTLTLKNSEGCDSIVRIKIRTNVTPMVPSSYGTFDIGYNTGAIEVRYGWDYTHRWSTGDTTYFLKNLKAGVYTDTITGKEGCIDTLVFDILKVIPYEMPNAFTPNDDGLNDWFAPVTNARCRVDNFKIFNRLGHLVYDNEEPTLGWDGKIKGQDAASDVYAYWIEMYFGKGAPILKHTGEVILIR